VSDALFVDHLLQIGPAIAVSAAVVLIGFASGGLPGIGSLAAPVLTLAFPFETAQKIVLPLFVISQTAGAWIHWKDIRWRELSFVVMFSTVGNGIGWIIWDVMLENPNFPVFRLYLKLATACLVMALAINIYLTRIRQPPLSMPNPGATTSALWCILAGTLSTVANLSGSLVVWFLNTRHLTREQLTATIAASYVLINLLKFIPYSALGFYSTSNIAESISREVTVLPPILIIMIAAIVLGKWRLQATTPRRFNIALVTAMITVTAGIMW